MKISLNTIRYNSINGYNAFKTKPKAENNYATNLFNYLSFKGLADNNRALLEERSPRIEEDSYDEFVHLISEKYDNEPLNEICKNIINNKDNYYAEGNSKIVYSIPDVSDYLIAKLKSEDSSDIVPPPQIRECENEFKKYNFGQPVGTNGVDILILKKIRGYSHSIDNWAIRYLGTMASKWIS